MPDHSILVPAIAVLAGLALGPTAVARGSRGRGSLGLLDLAAAVAVALVVMSALVAVTGMPDVFALAGHGSRFVFAVAPIVVTVTAVMGHRRGVTWPARACVMGAALTAGVGVYATHVEPMWLRVDTVDVPVAMAADVEIRVAVLADLQTDGVGAHERRAIDAIIEARPDIVLFAGDLFQGDDARFAAERMELRAELQRLDAPHGVYFAEGDVDRYDRATWLLDGTDIRRLDDEIVDLEVRGQQVRIGGNRIDWTTAAATSMRAELASSDPDDLVILLAHRPDAVLDLPPDSAVDLTVAGHTHGGQVVLPGFGPLVTYTDVPRHVARGGLDEIDGNTIYVSTGVGVERAPAPRLRLFNRPSVNILDLASTADA